MKRQQTPLMAAASGSQVDVARMLLKIEEVQHGVDMQDSLGRTALMRAAAVGALNVTALLLNAGCDRTLKDNEGLTARDHASKHSYTVMFQFISQSMVR
jgi:ankyrin repeat protein